MKTITRKAIALALTLCMAMSLLTVSALAVDDDFEVPEAGKVNLSLTATKSGSYYLVRYRASIRMQEEYAEAAASARTSPKLKDLTFDCVLRDDLVAQMPDGSYSEQKLADEYNFSFRDNDIYTFEKAEKSGDTLILVYKLNPDKVDQWKTMKAADVKAELMAVTAMSASREVPRSTITSLKLPMSTTAAVEIDNLSEVLPGVEVPKALEGEVGDVIAKEGDVSLRIVTPGGHSPSSSTPSNPKNVTVIPAERGVISVGDTAAEPGENVIIRVQPDDGYKVDNIIVTDANGKVLDVERVRKDVYTFVMPDTDVTVTATFVPEGTEPVDPDPVDPGPVDPDPVDPGKPSTGVDKLLNNDDHIAYIQGYPDGTVKPNGKITRAEVATILYRLLRNQSGAGSITFSDVKPGQWFATAVNTLAAKGIINGYPDGTFKPNDQISRAEFVTMVVRFSNQEQPANLIAFGDLAASHWAYQNIQISAGYGWVNGYEDGTFRPNGKITRAETATIMNRILERSADQLFVLANMGSINYFSDLVDQNAWYYWEMVEATNAHTFNKAADGETWTSLVR